MTVRAQVNLPALAVALVLLTATATLALALADDAFDDADRTPAERRIATALTERLVAPDSPLTDRANVLDGDALAAFDAARLRETFPVVGERAVRVRVGDRTLVERGDPIDGVTVRRVVLVRRQQAVELQPQLDDNETTLPRRTRRVTLDVDPPTSTTVRTVRADGRVVLHAPSGLDGEYTVRVSRFDTVTLAFETDGFLAPRTVGITYYPARTTKATLAVTVDA